MLRISIRTVRIPFRMVRICIRIPFEWFEFGFEFLESRLKGSNLDLNASNAFRMVWICIGTLWITFKWLDLHLNGSNPFLVVRIGIQKLQNPLESFEFAFECPVEWFEFGFECFKSLSNGLNLHSNASNPFWMVRICIQKLQIHFAWLKFPFNTSHFTRRVPICIRMLRIWFECFESLLNS